MIRNEKATIVTDRIATFTAKGIELESGDTLEADIVVSATGLNIQIFGGATMTVDGVEVDPGQTTTYLGAMLTQIPNFAFTIGYINAPGHSRPTSSRPGSRGCWATWTGTATGSSGWPSPTSPDPGR